jgi:hypothetical protein
MILIWYVQEVEDKLKQVDTALATTDVDFEDVVAQSASLTPPNDIRQAVFLLVGAQKSVAALKKDAAELRSRALVTYRQPRRLEVTLRTGEGETVCAVLRAHLCYPNVS